MESVRNLILMVKALMVITMKVSGKMMKNLEMELTFGQMEENMLENSKITQEMDLVMRLILMVRAMKVSGKMMKDLEMELTFGQMEENMSENSKMTQVIDLVV